VGESETDLGCEEDLGLHLFDLRGRLAAQAAGRSLRTWFGRGGELFVSGLPGSQEIDGVIAERALRLRVVSEGTDEPETWLVVRSATRRLSATLDRLTVDAAGETAERVSGTGPRRGILKAMAGSSAVLESRGEEINVQGSDYRLSIGSPFIRRHFGSKTLAKLMAFEGTTTSSGRRNAYAVKDRYKLILSGMDALSWTIDMGIGVATVRQAWTEIRIQGAF
jgi:hypothetical protein